MEQGSTTRHKCKEISWNKYKIKYDKNATKVIGSMGNSTHMYNNATEYEGNTLEKVQTSLSKNKYQRPGYSFVGWNTKKDGTGTSYTDEQEILNLTTVNDATITLYAQWEKCDTTLLIKAEDGTNATSGATYNGKAQYSTKVDYLGTERVQKSLTIPGKGYKINFDTNGGTITGMGQTGLKNVNGTSGYTTVSVRDAKDWIQTFPNEFNSSYEADGSDAIFTNKATENGYTYILQVTYDYGSFTLPGVNKEGQSFVGWELITGVGNKQFATGEGVTPTENISTNGEITFKAKYAELSMQATPDYETNNMKGAADLVWEWTQNVTNISSYKIYRDGNLININASGDEGEMPNLGTVIDSYASGTFTVEYSGVYEFTLKGNKGTDYNGHTGGSGGYITGQVFLNKGDILQYTSSDSDYAGGKGEKSSGGNAATIKIKRAGTNNFVPLIVAGGGSGASDTTNGTSVAVSAETGAANNSHTGSAGMYAGGGGWTGGAAGELIYHDHDKSYCVYHKHDDGCYYSHKHGDSCYGDWKTDHWCSVCGESWNIVGDNMCGNPKCEGNPEAVLQWGEPYWDADELICTKDTGIDYSNRICGKTETWYTKEGEKCTLDGAVESAKSASAGTNYINAEEVFNYSFSTNAGKGSVFVKSVKLGFETDTYLNDAKAEDKAAPDRPVLTLTSTDYAKKQAVFSIKKPNDNGTAYTFSVEAYANGNKQASATAVPNPVVLTTNVKGYKIEFYNKNTNALLNTVTTNLKVLQKARDGLATVTDSADVKYTRALQTYPQQVRVYAIDFAGNTSAVATLDLPGISETQKPSDPVTPDTTYPVETEYVKAVENANTYRKGNKTVNGTSYPLYYVKADGQTPFTLLGRGYTSGAADLNLFRVHEFDYKILDIAKNTNVKDPNTTYAVNTEELDTAFTQTGYGVPTNKTQLLDAYTSPEYKRDTENGQKGVQTKMLFTASSAENGKQMLVIPGAAGKNLNTDKEVTSDAAKDKKSGVVLIPDAEAPYVNGGNIDELKKIEEGTFKFPTTITIPIKDDLSGVSNAFAEVSSTQSGSYKKYPMDENGNIVIKVTEDDVLFVADITISITTIDNVGNEGHFEYYYSAAMKLDIDIVNKDALVNGKEKHNYFLYDDTGILSIHTEGYVDTIEISQGTNPKALFTDNNKTTYTISFDGSKADLMLGWAELEYDKELEFKVTDYMEGEVYFEVTCKKTGSGNVTVNHYKQNVDGKGYTLESTSSVPRRSGATYTATPYKFTGFTSPANKTVTVSDNTVIDLYYTRNQYTVTLETEEGVKSVSGAGTYYYGQPVTVSMTAKNGYTFSKWVGNTDSSTQSKYTFNMPAYNVTLRASMEGNAYTIYYDGNGATGGSTVPGSLAYGETGNLTTNGFVRTGYVFAGWNTKADGTGTSYKDTASVKNLVSDGTSITLYAKYVTWDDVNAKTITFTYPRITYTVYLKSESGNSSFTYNVETDTITLPTPTREGYAFTGWTGANGTTPQKSVTIYNANWNIYNYDKIMAAGYIQ